MPVLKLRYLIVGVALLCTAVAMLALVLTLRQPWTGLRLSADAGGAGLQVVAAEGPSRAVPGGSRLLALRPGQGAEIPVSATTLIEEPDQLPDFETLTRFRAEQGALATALRQPSVGLVIETPQGLRETVEISPEPRRPLRSLPPVFWVQILTGALGVLMGGWVWALRPAGRTEGFLLLAGLALQVSASAAAVYSVRELALPRDMFTALTIVNAAGSLGFGVGLIGLFLSYPHRIGPVWLLWAQALVLTGWWLANALGLMPSNAIGFQLPIVLALLAIFVCVYLQWRATRGDLPSRAALRLFALGILLGAGGFVMTSIVPALLGLEGAVSQGYAFAFFTLIYGSLVLAVLRYRLFDLDRWAFNALFYMGGAVVFLTLDALLIYGLSVERVPALAVSLLAVALVYLPLRDYAVRRVLRRTSRRLPLVALVQIADEITTPRSGVPLRVQWERLLAREYEAMSLQPLETAPPHAMLDEEGVSLLLPAVPPLPGYRLRWAEGGRRLFSTADMARGDEVTGLLAQLVQSRGAFEAGMAEERERIARDIHDNIGFHLMGALHSHEPRRKDELIRESLADLRQIISSAGGGLVPLAEALADLREDMMGFAEEAGLALDWPLYADREVDVSPALAHALRSVIREALNNARRHAGATRVSVGIGQTGDGLTLCIADDGRGSADLSPARTGGGHGLRNIRRRIEAMGGKVTIDTAPGAGFRIALTLPLAPGSDAPHSAALSGSD